MRKSITSLGVLSLFLMGGLAYAQVSGVVKDSSGLPLEEAEVVLDRTGASVFTDANGSFTIDANIGDTLRIIDINGEERTIKVASNKIGDIKLAPSRADEISLSTVNLVGGVKMDASQKVGAYDVIKKEDFELAPTASIDEVLNGRVAGLVFSTNSGDPGSTNIITIRGVGSIIGTTNPLYVIDGVVVGKGSDNAGLMESWNPLASIDPNMIEDVTVLKDASATALYGARGANGVIVIKTKKGKYGAKTRFNLSTDMAIQDIAFDEQNWMNANQYIQWGGLAYFNTGNYASRDAAVEAFKTYLNYDGVTDTDWQGAVMRNTASVRTYNFSAAGGSENTSFRVGGSFYENKPLVLNSNFERLSVNSALEHKIEDKFNFGMNLNFTNVERTSVNDGGAFRNPWLQSWAISPTRPIYNADGSYNQLGLGPGNDNFNPVALQNTDFLEGTIQTYLGSIHGEWQFAKNFYFYTLFGAQYQSLSEKNYWGPDMGDGMSIGGYVNKANTGVFDWNWQNSVSYRKLIKDVHDVQVWAGIEYQEHKYNRNSAYVTQLEEPKPYLSYGTVRNYTGDAFYKWTQISYFSRANYTFNNKITVSGQLRRDSNSTLGINDKSGVFWSVGANYNILKESFSPKFLSTFTVRANYGEIGNIPYADNWGDQYNAYSISGLGLYGDNTSSESIVTAGDPDLRWEVSKQWNVGADFGILDNKLVLGVDVYDKRTVDAIYSGQIPLQNGAPTSYYTNIGEISNKGIEMTLNARPINKEFRWNVYGNFSYNKNILEALTEDPNQIITGSGNGIRALGVGHEIGEYYTYSWAGVDRETGAGLYYTDASHTETTTDKGQAERVWQGVSPFPKYTAGLKNEFSYKGFSLSVFFTGQFEYAVHNMWQNYVLGDGSSVNYNQTTDALYDSWTPENRDAKNPIQVAGNTSQSQLLSSRWMRDGDHIRLKEAKLAYSFGDKFKQQTGIHNLTIYAKGVNLWLYTFDEDLTFDPEANSNAYGGWAGKGLYDYTSPIMKSISLGISVDF